MDLMTLIMLGLFLTQAVIAVFIYQLTVIMREIKDEKILVTKIEASGKWVQEA